MDEETLRILIKESMKEICLTQQIPPKQALMQMLEKAKSLRKNSQPTKNKSPKNTMTK